MRGFSSRDYDESDLWKVLQAKQAERNAGMPKLMGPLGRPEQIEARPPLASGPLQTQTPSYAFDPPTRTVGKGMTVEGMARDQYGDDWRAGVGAIMRENRLRTNANGSPMLRVGQDVRMPNLGGYAPAEQRRLGSDAGQLIAANEARLAGARQAADSARQLNGTRYDGLSGDDLALAVATSYRESLAAAEQGALAGTLVAQKFVPRGQWGARPPLPEKLTNADDPYKTITLHHTGRFHQTPQSVQSLHLGSENALRSAANKVGFNFETYPEYGDVGYNYMVGKDGAIYQGRSTAVQGAHVLGHNRGNVGVAALGDYSNKPLTPAQLASIRALTATLSGRYPIEDVATHGEFDQQRRDEMRGAMPQLSDLLDGSGRKK
jgi:hypothetical protein